MSRARGLITGEDLGSRSSGMYDIADNLRTSLAFSTGLKYVGIGSFIEIYDTDQTTPDSFAWSPDGLHLYFAYDNRYIRHLELTTPWDTSSGITTQATFDCDTLEDQMHSIEVSSNGRYLYLGGSEQDCVLQFTMNNPWDIAAGVTTNTFNSGYEQIDKRIDNTDGHIAGARGFEWNGDGTKFYLIYQSARKISQFSLSTAYELGNYSHDGDYDLDADGASGPYALRWNNDGSKFFVADLGLNAVTEYSASNSYDVTSGTITEGTVYVITAYEGNPLDVAFNADGTKMYVIGSSGDEINEWTLSVGFDLSSTVTHVSATSLGTGSSPAHFEFNPSGTKLVVVDFNADTFTAFNLSTAFDSSTISDYEEIDLSNNMWKNAGYLTNYWKTPTGLRFNSDGTEITFMDRDTNNYKLTSVPLTTAYELSSFSDGCIDFDSLGYTAIIPTTIRFNPDGTKVYVLDSWTDQIHQWSLNKPYVLGRGSTAMTYAGISTFLTDTDDVVSSFDFTPDGKNIYTCGTPNDRIGHYTLSIPYDVTSTLTHTSNAKVASIESYPQEIRVVNRPEGYKLHILGSGSDKINQIDINF